MLAVVKADVLIRKDMEKDNSDAELSFGGPVYPMDMQVIIVIITTLWQ
jgi:hypothetical protein